MLFDLRGRGRRRTIKAIYLSLAILMGGGLVLFGIGGDVQGGLFDAFDSQQTQGEDIVQERLDAAEERVAANPRDPAAFAALAEARLQAANSPENFNATLGQFTAEGRRLLSSAQQAFERHLELAGDDADPQLANRFALALGPEGLQDYDAAVRALEIAIAGDEEPSAAQYAQLAILADLAGQQRKSTLAERQAVELAPRDQREQIKAQIALAKQQAQQQAQQQPEPVVPPGG